MAVVAMKQLLEAGVHFGHQTRRWDPKMAEYIFQARNGIHIIDLQKTSKKLDEAYAFLKEQAEEGKTILFVTHNITDVIRNCTRTIIINDGKKIYDGDVKGGVERYKKIIVKLDSDRQEIDKKEKILYNKHIKSCG